MENISARIYDAISRDDANELAALIARHPEQLKVHSFMAGQTWLGYASWAGKRACVEKLLSLGADINLGDAHYGAKPICSACSGGREDVAQILIEAGSDLDTDSSAKNPLFAAVVGRSIGCATALLDAGIDYRARYDSETMDNMDAIAFALMRGEHDIAQLVARRATAGDAHALAAMIAEADRIAERNAFAKRG